MAHKGHRRDEAGSVSVKNTGFHIQSAELRDNPTVVLAVDPVQRQYRVHGVEHGKVQSAGCASVSFLVIQRNRILIVLYRAFQSDFGDCFPFFSLHI